MTKKTFFLCITILIPVLLMLLPGSIVGNNETEPLSGDVKLIPGIIQAEDYGLTSRWRSLGLEGIDLRAVDGELGGYHVSKMTKGDWLAYKVTIPESGYFSLRARVASVDDSGFSMSIGGTDCFGVKEFRPVNGGDWEDITVHSFYLPEGDHELRFRAERGKLDLDKLSITRAVQTPYGGSPKFVPGFVQAENYDNGGQNVAYYDTTPGNICYYKAHRFQDVDVENNPVNPNTTNVGWIAANEWLEYTIEVRNQGIYKIFIMAACPTGGKVKIQVSTTDPGSIRTFPASGGDNQTYQSYYISQRFLMPGQYIVRVTMLQGMWNFDNMHFMFWPL